jgi:5,10-methylenetetrahydromethanopterin reductase
MSMQFGLGFGQDQTVHTMTEYARLADDLGYQHITVADINNLAHEVNVLMTIAAMGTSRIHIGHGVTNPATYHPGAIANAVASLRDLSGGRAFVGIGAGGPYGQLLHKGVLMRELHESIQFIKDYSSGGEGTWKGDSWHNEWIRASEYNGEAVPVWVAVAGPKTCRITGAVGDAVLSIGMDPELQKWRMEQVAEGAEKAGRDPAEIEFWARTQCFIADTQEECKRELEPYAATCTYELCQIMAREHPASIDLRKRIERRHPGIMEEFGRIYDAYDPYWTERVDGPQTEFVTQRVIDFFLAAGPPEHINGQLAALEEIGVKGISTVMFSIENDFDMMRTMASELMSKFE